MTDDHSADPSAPTSAPAGEVERHEGASYAEATPAPPPHAAAPHAPTAVPAEAAGSGATANAAESSTATTSGAPGVGDADGDGAADEPVDDATTTVEPVRTVAPTGKRKRRSSFARELPILIAIALLLALLIKAFLVQAFFIPSGSMENTLHVGDRVLVNKLIYRFRGIHRGEVVVFNGNDTSFRPEVTIHQYSNPVVRFFRSIAGAIGVAPAGEKDFIKRVIGVGGDHVACCDSKGRVTVNGTPLDEPYLFPGDSPNAGHGPFSVTVPKDHLWVMGDHRSNSADSREYINEPGGGFVPTDKVIGRAFVKVWPPSHIGTLPVPKTFRSIAADVLVPATQAPAVAGVVGTVPIGLLRWRRRRRRARRAAVQPRQAA
jgi:signal peptidase I